MYFQHKQIDVIQPSGNIALLSYPFLTTCHSFAHYCIEPQINTIKPFPCRNSENLPSIRFSEVTSDTTLRMWYFSRVDDNGCGIRPSTETSTYQHRDARYGRPPNITEHRTCRSISSPPATSARKGNPSPVLQYAQCRGTEYGGSFPYLEPRMHQKH